MNEQAVTIPTQAIAPAGRSVILFDGVCNMCNSSINYVIDHDPGDHFRFASLQSEVGQRLAAEHGIDASELSSMVLIESGQAYVRSSAVLRVCRGLSGPAKLLWLFIIVPTFLRDPIYSFIAKRRYRFFGKRESCRLPTPADRERFL